jgi:hypothetical protein
MTRYLGCDWEQIALLAVNLAFAMALYLSHFRRRRDPLEFATRVHSRKWWGSTHDAEMCKTSCHDVMRESTRC